MKNALISLLLLTSTTAAFAAQQPPPTVTADAKDGFGLRSADGHHRVRITGYGHFDGRFFPGDDDAQATDTFVVRRLRPVVSGVLAGRFEFQFMPDFGNGATVLQDGWVDTRFTTALRLRAGKMKAPVGLERLTSATSLLFLERAYPTSLLPNRDVGVQLHGEVAAGRVAYQAGFFNGVVDGGSADLDASDGKDVAGRLWLQPFRATEGHVLRGLGVGFAATSGRQSGALATYRSGGQSAVFTYAAGVSADGSRRRHAPQASYTAGPVRAMAEYARSTSRLRRGSAVDDVELSAWQVAAGVLLTGEKNAWGAVDPRDPFSPAAAGKGAVELAARYTAFRAGDEVFEAGWADRARSVAAAREATVGLNWWLTRGVKYVLNLSRTTFDGGAAAGGDRPTENALMMRVQVAF